MADKLKWRDTSSHAQSTKDRTPTSWTLGTSRQESVVVHRHIDHPGVWCVTCLALGIKGHPMMHTDVEVALESAVAHVWFQLNNLYERMGTVLGRQADGGQVRQSPETPA